MVVAGSVALDLSCDYGSTTALQRPSKGPHRHTSNPSIMTQSIGGVGHNVATAIHLLGVKVRLCSAIGKDSAGKAIQDSLNHRQMDSRGLRAAREEFRTAQYVAFNDSQKELEMAMADMTILEKSGLDVESTWRPQLEGSQPKWFIVDANWDGQTIHRWADLGRAMGARVAFEPVSEEKSTRFCDSAKQLPLFDLATPNEMELRAMFDAASNHPNESFQSWIRGLKASGIYRQIEKDSNLRLADACGALKAAIALLCLIPCIVTKMGKKGLLLTNSIRQCDLDHLPPNGFYHSIRSTDRSRHDIAGISIQIFPAAELSGGDIISVNGAGDTFLGILIAGLCQERPKRLEELLKIAQRGSVMTLKSKESVSPDIRQLRPYL